MRRDAWGRLYPLFFIAAPTYSLASSGIRCLFLLCDLLNRLGYEAYVGGQGAPSRLKAPYMTIDGLEKRRLAGRDDIVVYPETVRGNPFLGRKVVRYLLNRPGAVSDVGMGDYGRGEFFAHFAEEFRPEGLASQPLRMPTVDAAFFRPAPAGAPRAGFVLYENRVRPTIERLPPRIAPWTVASIRSFRMPEEMVELYRRSEALVVWERSSAILEALHCGCPVIVAPDAAFHYAPFIATFSKNGIAIGWNPAEFERAKATVGLVPAHYRRLYAGINETVEAFVQAALRFFAASAAAGGSAR